LTPGVKKSEVIALHKLRKTNDDDHTKIIRSSIIVPKSVFTVNLFKCTKLNGWYDYNY